jgi:hypothetical protein
MLYLPGAPNSIKSDFSVMSGHGAQAPQRIV